MRLKGTEVSTVKGWRKERNWATQQEVYRYQGYPSAPDSSRRDSSISGFLLPLQGIPRGYGNAPDRLFDIGV
jgi:hypothetical protein